MLREQLATFPEQIERLTRAVGDTRQDADAMREQRDNLQARVDDLTRQAERSQAQQPKSERTASVTRSDVDSLRGEIRDLARAVKEGQSALPRILAMTREVREAALEQRTTSGQNTEALHRVQRAIASLLENTEYLVELAEQEIEDDDDDGDEAEGAGERQTQRDEGAADSAEDTVGDDDWEKDFDRIEKAWLAGRRCGDPHEALNFLILVTELGISDREPSDIVARFDRFRARAGGEPERFSYCPLHGATHIARQKPSKRPSLDDPMVLVRYRDWRSGRAVPISRAARASPKPWSPDRDSRPLTGNCAAKFVSARD